MGFISSILCCSSDSSQVTSKWDNREVNSRSQLQGREQINIRTSYSPGTSTNSNSGTVASSKNSGRRIRTQKARKKSKENNNKPVGLYCSESWSRNQELQGMGVRTKQHTSSAYNGGFVDRYPWDCRSTSDRHERPITGSKNKIKDMEKEQDLQIEEEESEKDNELPNNDVDSEEAEGEKRGVYIYTGDTDTSTGGSSYDRRSQMPPSTNQPPPSPSLNEKVTTVNEGGNAGIADNAMRTFEHSRASDADVNRGMEVDAIPPYEEEEFVDLTELQPNQYRALGCNTLLPPQSAHLSGKKCLVLDLDETLVHSSFKYLKGADFVLPVDIDDQIHNVYVMKRPGVDEFLKKVGNLFEVVVFTASVARYGDPLLDILDKHNCVHHRLFREACYNYEGNYIKNLSQIGRPLSEIIILDNSPASYIFHPQHAIPISSWFSDTHDNELLDIVPLLEDLSEQSVPDVGKVLDITI